MAISDLFKIQDIPTMNGCEWSVSWPDWGRVRKPENQVKMLNIAFGLGSPVVGIAFEGPHQRVLFLQETAWKSTRTEDIVFYYEMDPIVGLAFPDKISAEQFVDQAEQIIAWNLLNRQFKEE